VSYRFDIEKAKGSRVTMAVSPMVYKEETADGKVSATKIKSLAVRQNSSDGTKGKPNARAATPGPEISDQLNDELRDKYIKGMRHPEYLRNQAC
jgi:hypothetical protein